MNRFATILISCFASAFPAESSGQPARASNDAATIRIESSQTRKRLSEVQEKIKVGKHDEALTELQSIIDDAGDELVSAESLDQLIPARRVAHALIGTLPESVLKSYRDRVNSAAQSLYEKSKRTRDSQPIRELLDRYFHSRISPDALAFLGDLQFERGEYSSAESTWRRLIPGAGPAGWNVNIAAKDAASIHARISLAMIYRGNAEQTAAALQSFRESFATAKGTLAGRTGLLIEILTDVSKRTSRQVLATSPRGTWNTLGGNASRSGRVDSQMPRVWPSGPTWRTPIPNVDAAIKNTPDPVSRSSTFHPAILEGKVYIAEAGRIFSFDLKTGRRDIAFDLRAAMRKDSPVEVDTRMPHRADADFALCVADGHLYARLGTPSLWQAGGEAARSLESRSFLLGLSPQKGGFLSADWRRYPPGPDGTMWEGVPAFDRGRLIAGTVRLNGGRLVHSLVCLDAGTSDVLWETTVADSPVPTGEPRTRHELVTLIDDLAIYNTQAGASVALFAATGKPAWAIRYPSAKPTGKALALASASNHRDISPPIAFDGIVCLAPNDTDRIVAVEASSGRVLWEKQGLRVESLVGVSRNRFVATLAGPVRGIRAFDMKTGSDESPTGWQNHDDPGLASLGRGLVSDEQILWPTRAGLFVLRSSDGRLARPPILGPHGNLAYAEGVLVVANTSELLGYVIPEATRTPRLPIPDSNDALPKRIAIAAPATIAAAQTLPIKPLPPIVVRKRTKTVAVPWANGVLPSDERAGIWLVGRDCVARVSPSGEVGEKINTKFTPTRVAAIGSKFAFTNGETFYRHDTEATFDIHDLHPECESITSLAVGHGILAVRIGEHHLAALDAVTFQVKWVIDATGRVGYWPYHHSSPYRFGPHLLVTSSGIVCQRLDGQMLVVEPTMGEVRFHRPTTIAPWSRPPLLHDEFLLVPGGPGQIVAFEPSDGVRLWGSETPNVSGLAGLAPSLHRVVEDLFVGIVRNHGAELQHLAPDTGRLKWRRPVFLSQQTTVPFGMDGDGGTVFASTADSVVAVRKIDGRMIWRQPLPLCTAGWNVNAAIGGVILSPRTAIERDASDDSYLIRSLIRFPEPRRAFGHLSTWVESTFNRTVPIFVFESATGRELSRIDLPAVGMGVDCRFHASGGVVATAGSIYLLK